MSSLFTFQVGSIVMERNGFAIVRTTNGASVSGRFKPVEGYVYSAEGAWETHPTYGPQYKLTSAVALRLKTPEELGRFLVPRLKSKGVGEAVIFNLVGACKENGLDLENLLDQNQRDVLIECVGSRNAKKVDILLATWPSIKPAADIISPLLGYGLSEAMAESCVGLWGAKAVEYVEANPFELILHVPGVSFLTADRIAAKIGKVRKTDAIRLYAALATGLRDATAMGDLGVRRQTLLTKTMPLVNESVLDNGRRKLAPDVPLHVPEDKLAQALDEMITGTGPIQLAKGFANNLVEAPDAKGAMVVWYKPLIEAEKAIAARLAAFTAQPLPHLASSVDSFAAVHGASLAVEQKAAIEMALLNPVSVVAGGPGCGKSFLLKVLLTALASVGLKGHLAAPTGKAAKRITESTGRPAQTMHSLIGFQAGGSCVYNAAEPLTCDYLVIDECSMVDTELLAATLNAAPLSCRIILVGDVDQLASVGPGQVLRDIINSNTIPVTRLTKGFRFSGGIATAARAMNAGIYPENSDDKQFEIVETEEPAKDLLEAAKLLLASGVNEDDIQVLAPTHKGDAGCIALNQAMQRLLNPIGNPLAPKLKRDSGDIYAGDRVIQTKNDRELRIVNGDLGWVDAIGSDSGEVQFKLADRDKPLCMKRDKSQNLSLAYAITIHKSQGAEAPYVLIALDSAGAFMLRRSLVYTGTTRGSKKVMIFASRTTLAGAIRRGEPAEGSRRTSLVPKLQAAFRAKAAKLATESAPALLADFDDVPW